MNVLILCDSKFGNTRQLAEAMAAALKESHTVRLRSAADGLRETADVDVLLVGGPTQAHGASKPLKEALRAVPEGSLIGKQAAAFDTRFNLSRLLTGSAAAAADKLLKRAGASIVAPAQSFFVTRDNPPVLGPGELERAATWARGVVQ